MIVRLVKMTFRADEVEHFQQLFEEWRHRIIAFPGCRELELLHDLDEPGTFFTRSEWDSAEDLDAYRNSPVFADVWPVVKELFASQAEAWSLRKEHHMKATTADSPSRPNV